MDDRTTYWASIAFGALALLLLVVNVSLVNSNRHLQEEIVQRQALINKGVSFSQANQGLVQALATLAVRAKDNGARDLLAAQGITVKARNGEDGESASEKSATSEKKRK